MAAPVIVYALDSADLSLLEPWMAEGRLPHIAGLWRNSALRRIGGPGYWDEVGSWLTAYSGVPATQHGYYSARRLKPGSYELEIEPLASAHARPCWESSKNPNFRSLILDPIEVTLGPYTGGAQVCNLLAHQETYAAGPPLAIPDSARALVRRIWGRRRNPGFEQFHEPLDFYQRQLALNLDLSQRRRLLFHELIRGNEFDLLVVGINLHDIVHLLWPFQQGRDDPRDPNRQLAHGVRTVYEEADREIGEIQKLLPPDSTEVLLSLYGVKDQYPTQELSQRLLELLGYQVPFTGDGVSWSPLGVARHLLPESLRFQISALLPDRLQQSLLSSGFARSMDFRRSRAFVVPTGPGLFSSHIRVNLKGREPTGCVAPGRDYEELINDLERQFRALIDPVTGKPAVASVLRTANEFIDGPSQLLPDLFVHWKSSRHFLRSVVHPQGEITQRRPHFFRDSFHGAPGFAAFRGPAIEPSASKDCSILDIAPTLLRLLGEPPSSSLPGRDTLAS